MKKTKIICSIGPSSNQLPVLKEMAQAGMNVVRFNFSHGTYEEKKQMVNIIKALNESSDIDIAILYDTKGPEIRIGKIDSQSITLIPGQQIKFVKHKLLSNVDAITITPAVVFDELNVNNEILIDDGLIKVKVIAQNNDGVKCEVICGGELSSFKSVSIPGIKPQLEYISEQDRQDIIFACQNEADFLALSFVNCKEDVISVRQLLAEYGRHDMHIIAKIESSTSIDNIDEIIKISDGVMIARGDLGVETSLVKLPILQKDIINKCRKQGKICIVATEMLASMYQNARPSRAEISDIANAVFDGADAVMLSGETAIGKYPVEATKHMAEACLEAEKYELYSNVHETLKTHDIPSMIAHNVVDSTNLLSIKAIVAATKTGYTAKLISNLKPHTPILATCMSDQVARSLALNYGVYPFVVEEFHSIENIIDISRERATKYFALKTNDLIVITGGIPVLNKERTTNFMQIERI